LRVCGKKHNQGAYWPDLQRRRPILDLSCRCVGSSVRLSPTRSLAPLIVLQIRADAKNGKDIGIQSFFANVFEKG
jgi:hypothetical protein